MEEHNQWKETKAPWRIEAFYFTTIVQSKKQPISNQQRKINSWNHCPFSSGSYHLHAWNTSTAENHTSGCKLINPQHRPRVKTTAKLLFSLTITVLLFSFCLHNNHATCETLATNFSYYFTDFCNSTNREIQLVHFNIQYDKIRILWKGCKGGESCPAWHLTFH